MSTSTANVSAPFSVPALPAEWRARAAVLRAHGASEAARTAEALARELDEALRSGETEPACASQPAARRAMP
jgi:hypothetical protein